MPNIPIKELIDLLGEEGAAKRLGVPPKVCPNETCPRGGKPWYFHQDEDGSYSSQPHTKGTKFCRRQCAKTATTREWRRRRRLYRSEIRRLAKAMRFKAPSTRHIDQAWKSGVSVAEMEERLVLAQWTLQQGWEALGGPEPQNAMEFVDKAKILILNGPDPEDDCCCHTLGGCPVHE